ncbi:hypothetical protein [Sphingomonas sp. BE137]|uniref:hypothetical protein n=1 Tax=Sphingomonas sp. BE137 TaxID=2817844 RepID=UPI001AE2E4C3|nr:hypothetical protein [Sphingomonas sp. BE137]MDR6850384.1 hypothetical protein [Sphingomonas sp. BE137]
MKTTSLMAGASRFAHFAGLSRSASRRASDDEDTTDCAAQDGDDDADDMPSDDEPKTKKGKKSRRAAEDDCKDDNADDKDASEGGDDDTDEEPKARGKKSKRAADDECDEDEDDDKQEMTGRSSAASARRRERARCAAIFANKAAVNNIPLAASLAFETTMTRQEAIAVLKGQEGRAPAPSRSSREARNPDLSTNDGPDPSKPKAGAAWGRSFTKLGVAPR